MPATKPERAPQAGEKWEGRNLMKSSSANNDSGYVEHELSDSDEYFFKDKHERWVEYILVNLLLIACFDIEKDLRQKVQEKLFILCE